MNYFFDESESAMPDYSATEARIVFTDTNHFCALLPFDHVSVNVAQRQFAIGITFCQKK